VVIIGNRGREFLFVASFHYPRQPAGSQRIDVSRVEILQRPSRLIDGLEKMVTVLVRHNFDDHLLHFVECSESLGIFFKQPFTQISVLPVTDISPNAERADGLMSHSHIVIQTEIEISNVDALAPHDRQNLRAVAFGNYLSSLLTPVAMWEFKTKAMNERNIAAHTVQYEGDIF
jgi:hypothetical protein